MAAIGGHLDCLRYLHENGCERGVEYIITNTAGRYGHLDCLKYLLECGFEFFKDGCFHDLASSTCEHLCYLPTDKFSNRLKTIEFIKDYDNMSNDRIKVK